jgi:hypothetical protein
VIVMVHRGDRHLALLVFVTLVTLVMPATQACRKRSIAATASLDATADAAADASSAPPPAPPSAPPSALPAPTSTSTSMFEGMPLPPQTPFAGRYRCLKGLELVQTGDIVRGTVHTSASTDTIIVCNAGPDTCVGTVREIQQARGRPPKVGTVKPITLRRAPSGDVLVQPATGAATHCPKL